ncbi:MAG: histidine kinase [Bacillota bacterium]|nr:histidine kinase [Bacillota bacterium]
MAGISRVTRNFITVERQPSTLRRLLFWNMVLIALITVAVVGSLLHVSLIRAIRQGVENEQALLAHQVSRTLETSLLNAVNMLHSAAQEPAFLASLFNAHPEIREAYAVNSEGAVTAFFARDHRQPPAEPVAAVATASRYFRSGGRFYIAPARAAGGLETVALIAVPQFDGGKPAGMLVAELSADALADTLTGLTADRRIGVYLAQEDGRFLGPKAPPGWVRLPDKVRDRAAQTPVGVTVSAVVGDSLVTVMRTPWTGWPVVIQEATDIAFNPIRLARWAFFVLTPLAMLIASLLAVRQATLIAGEEARRIERLAVAVVEAQENERRRIAQDIHDWTAQRITSSYYHVQLLQKMLAKDPTLVAKELPHLAATLDSANTELREIMRNLHPHLLNEMGLVAAVKELVMDFARSAGLEYRVSVPESAAEPPRHISIALFRILQEALSNVEKHASAQRVEVTLKLLPDRATLMVSDDGVGFDSAAEPPIPSRVGHFGLSGMQERAELLGGTFRLTTTPGRGTTVEVIIPWNPEANRLSAS